MTSCLITGCGGFIGGYLAELVMKEGLTVTGLVRPANQPAARTRGKAAGLATDITDRERLGRLVGELKPDYIFHLAAQSSIPESWRAPEQTFETNTLGTLHLLDGVRAAGIRPVIVIAGSSAEYGGNQTGRPLAETAPPHPASPYAVSKLAAGALARCYQQAYDMKIIQARPFNITGPGKKGDVCADFARGIAEIEAGRRDGLEVGNLEAVRDFVDVRDTVAALWRLAEKGVPGEAYNICSGRGCRIGDILDRLTALSSRRIEVRRDPARERPADEPVIIGDNAKLRGLGWQPQIPLEKTLADILEYWRHSVTGKGNS